MIGDSHAQQYTQGLYDIFYRQLGKKVFVSQISQLFLPDFRRDDLDENYHRIFLSLFDTAIKVGQENPHAVFILGESWASQMQRASVCMDGSSNYRKVGYNAEGISLVIAKIRKLKAILGEGHKLVVIGCVPGVGNNDGPLNALLRPSFILTCSPLTEVV